MVARELGKLWATITDEDKQVYQNKAALERERVAQQIAAYKAANGGVLPSDNQDPAGPSTDGSLILPMARIRKICKLDPDVRGLSKESVLLVTKAAELMTAKLARETRQVAQLQNRRKLLPEDVVQVVPAVNNFCFFVKI